ncbi:MAG: stage III sporulation protein AD [Candidatus Gastranaerophilales bacterium]|nr:stage III sporulation protein AD [Candidatus Gastranaerophilales bacterium]
MSGIVKVGILGVAGVLLAVQFKGQRPEYGMYIGFGISILIFCFCLRQVETVMEQMSQVSEYLGGSGGYLTILLKVVGITYICEFSASICKDGGFGAVASQIEILGKLSVMFAGLPILFAVIEQIQGMI